MPLLLQRGAGWRVVVVVGGGWGKPLPYTDVTHISLKKKATRTKKIYGTDLVAAERVFSCRCRNGLC